jgi:hypothetical protein
LHLFGTLISIKHMSYELSLVNEYQLLQTVMNNVPMLCNKNALLMNRPFYYISLFNEA